MDVVADLPAHTQPPEPVQQGYRLLDHPPVDAQSGTVRRATAGDVGADALGADHATVLVVVIASIGVQRRRARSGPADLAAHRRYGAQQRHELGDIVAVPAGQRDGERDAASITDEVVFGARPGTVDRTRTRFGPPFIARTCELSITALDQSS